MDEELLASLGRLLSLFRSGGGDLARSDPSTGQRVARTVPVGSTRVFSPDLMQTLVNRLVTTNPDALVRQAAENRMRRESTPAEVIWDEEFRRVRAEMLRARQDIAEAFGRPGIRRLDFEASKIGVNNMREGIGALISNFFKSSKAPQSQR